ncbi:hypothetical protein [Piscinibacter sakaiensis]|uniref:hypothetical protein n=1 Tax=Piscinibacter sakaiensis TaxID=1547922 RepID=UPI003AAFC64B
MTDSYRPCKTCQADTSTHRIDSASGEEKTLTVTVRNLTVLTCPNGHRQFIEAEFPQRLLDHLVQEDEAKLPAGDEKGVLMFKHFHCHDCGRELEPKPDHRHTFTVRPGMPDQPGLEIDLAMPVYHCTGCGKEQLHSLTELRKLTPAALAHAFKAADMHGG